MPRLRLSRALAVLALLAALVHVPCRAAQELHGTSDAFAGEGVAIAWAVLRGATDDAAQVVLRIVVDPQRYAALAPDGVDPFSKDRKPLVDRRPIGATTTARFARRQFGEFPRTELQFYPAGAPQQSLTPQLVVYYLGVPDTTPEFAAEGPLDAYLNERMQRLVPAKPAPK